MEFTTLTYWACPIPECVSWLLRIANCWLLLWTTRVWIGPIIIINDLLHFPLPPFSTYGHNWWTWNVFLGLYISCTDLFAKHRQSVIQINCTSGWDVMTGPTDGQDLINWGFLFPVAKLLLPSGDLWFVSGVSQKPLKVVGKQRWRRRTARVLTSYSIGKWEALGIPIPFKKKKHLIIRNKYENP